ncbi:MAG: hypothetical protein ABIJ45_05085 [Candidatus Zixiibacteriota bacterium]
MIHRKYNHKKDKQAVHTIWSETGWIKNDNYEPMDLLLRKCRAIVADINGRAECLVNNWQGDMIYQNRKVRFSCVAGVTTSLVARKQNLAGKLTAEAIALDAAGGAEISGLGIFDQGFYNRLGFGNGTYEHMVTFSPSILNVDFVPRVPIRLGKKDWRAIHRARLNKMRLHGSCAADIPEATGSEMFKTIGGFGLGYKNNKGEITHFIWMGGKGSDHGPFHVWAYAYRTYDQFLELLALIKSFGEQVHMMFIIEPPNIQFQDFLDKPFRQRALTQKSQFENLIRAAAWWQMRILDLRGCVGYTRLDCEDIKFNLKLYDPIERFLDKDAPWRGITGNYIVTFGRKSNVKKGVDKSLPTLDTDVGAFTRLWLGCATASSLAVSDVFAAPDSLIMKLDRGLSIMPTPHTDWLF